MDCPCGLTPRVAAPVVMIASGVSLYAGAALAVGLFHTFPPAIVAWMRIAAAGLILVIIQRPKIQSFFGTSGRLAMAFGVVTLGMNMVFYEAIARLPLGTAVAIEFLGPIAVAAWGSHSRRDWSALLLAGVGVLVLSGAQWAASPSGVMYALTAAMLWAGYIMLGSRVAKNSAYAGARDALAIGFAWSAVVSTPLVGAGYFLVWGSGIAPGWHVDALELVGLALGLGMLSAVIPYSLDQLVMKIAGPGYFALLLALLPLTASLLGAVALGQMLSIVELLGIAAVVAAVALREPG
ncbi:EamA family transporter [Corynebacterium anserum]|uniref:EamA family transporter n=1 Tax=Corynebacterium anserum TaxID=2684406 RepID=UPI001FE263E2|nr:EamA family transporter [Corynebacterium anserum]